MYIGSTFKAIEYDVVTHHEAVTSKDPWDNEPAYNTKERRFCIVSTETGEVLDDLRDTDIKPLKKLMLLTLTKQEIKVRTS